MTEPRPRHRRSVATFSHIPLSHAPHNASVPDRAAGTGPRLGRGFGPSSRLPPGPGLQAPGFRWSPLTTGSPPARSGCAAPAPVQHGEPLGVLLLRDVPTGEPLREHRPRRAGVPGSPPPEQHGGDHRQPHQSPHDRDHGPSSRPPPSLQPGPHPGPSASTTVPSVVIILGSSRRFRYSRRDRGCRVGTAQDVPRATASRIPHPP